MQAATAIMRRVGTGLIENKKRAVQKSLSSGEIEKKDIVGHDLLSVLSEHCSSLRCAHVS